MAIDSICLVFYRDYSLVKQGIKSGFNTWWTTINNRRTI